MSLLQNAKIESVVFRCFDSGECTYTDVVVKGDHLPKTEIKQAAIRRLAADVAEADRQFARFMAAPPPSLTQLQEDLTNSMANLENELERVAGVAKAMPAYIDPLRDVDDGPVILRNEPNQIYDAMCEAN